MENNIDYRQFLISLQDRLYTTYTHMYLYYFKSIKNDELQDLTSKLTPMEKHLFQQESEASLRYCLISLRTFFDAHKNDKSLFNLYRYLMKSNKINDTTQIKQVKKQEQKEIIQQHILTDDVFRAYEKLLDITNKRVAHVDISQNPYFSYDDIEKIALRIEKVICSKLPLLLFNETHNYDHEETKKNIKTYLTKLYL